MMVRVLIVGLVFLMGLACSSGLGPKLVGTWRYEVDMRGLTPEESAALIQMQEQVNPYRVEIRADGTAVLINDKAKLQGTWSMEGRRLYIRSGESEPLEGDVASDASMIILEKKGTIAEGTTAKLMLVKIK